VPAVKFVFVFLTITETPESGAPILSVTIPFIRLGFSWALILEYARIKKSNARAEKENLDVVELNFIADGFIIKKTGLILYE
jgi:hypothetical protein